MLGENCVKICRWCCSFSFKRGGLGKYIDWHVDTSKREIQIKDQNNEKQQKYGSRKI